MKRLLRHLNRVEEYIMLAVFPPMLLIVLAATFSRYLGLFSIHWGEEAARYLMIWLGFAGISYGFRKNAHLGLSFMVDALPKALHPPLKYLRAAAILLFGGIVTRYAFLIIARQWQFRQISPSLHIPIWTVYAAMLCGGALIMIRTAQALLISGEAAGEEEETPS